jgi:hypothetical protein
MSNAPQPQPRKINWGWLTSTVLATAMIALTIYFGTRPQPVRIVSEEPPAVFGATGWLEPTEDERTQALANIAATQGMPADFGRIAQGVMNAADDDHSVFFWDAEQKVLGKVLGAWNQNPAGTCVSFGWGRDVQDLILGQIANGAAEEWPGHEVATEPIYGGSRVEVGHGRAGRGDGSNGSWAAQWVTQWGILFRQPYGQYDLSVYSVPLSRKWGSSGVPAELEQLAKAHPVKTAAIVTTADQLWAALGNGYPVPICSNVGFESHPKEGVLEPSGTWPHCMACRGRFVHKTAGKCVVIQQSWGDNMNTVGVHGRLTVPTADRGDVELPQGCFAVRLAVAGKMVAQRDSFAISGFAGFPAQKLDWFTRAAPRQRADVFAVFALAP